MTHKVTRHLYLAAPVHHYPEPAFVRCWNVLQHELRDAGVPFSALLPDGESHIDRARNNIVAWFLKSRGTHLMFIDSDQEFTTDDVMKLLESGKDLVGALIPKKGINWERVRRAAVAGKEDIEGFGGEYVVNHGESTVRIEPGGLVPVDAVGSGFMLISREAIERLIAAHPETHYLTDTGEDQEPRWALFDAGVYNDGYPRFLTEDYVFCRRARAIGIQPYLHVGVQHIGHVGKHTYRGNVASAFRVHRADGST